MKKEYDDDFEDEEEEENYFVIFFEGEEGQMIKRKPLSKDQSNMYVYNQKEKKNAK